jgi:methylated-DNA-[protein]-cysteine S-methyltransferase
VQGGAGPAWVAHLIGSIVALLDGTARPDLRDAELDWGDTPAFERRVYELTRAIEPGRTRSYGELALALGDASLARAVGQALGRNPWPIVVPCHRVLAAGGRPGGFSARGGLDTKLRLLEIEQAWPGDQPSLFAPR